MTPVLRCCGRRPAVMLRTGVWIVLAALVLVSRTALAWWQGLAAAFAIYLLTGGWKFLYIAIRTAPRDIKAGLRYLELKWYIRKCIRQNASIPTLFAEWVQKCPDKPCLIYEDQTWTYKQVDEYSNRVANFFAVSGYKAGDVVALYMESRPEYVCIWLGLSKIGVCTALINYNLRNQTLIHSVTVAEAKSLVFGVELVDAVKEIQGPLNHDFQYYCCGSFDTDVISARPLDKLLEESSALPPPSINTKVTDRLLYIYTSGTTGLPKPAIIHHTRYVFAAAGLKVMLRLQKDDILYNCLPLYHSAGGMLGIGQALVFGITVVIRRKFSASRFWDDCIKYHCTVAQYIGEICRYLLSQKPRAVDQQHTVRLMFGNGLRPQIWHAFIERFGIKEIGELYGATEGNANIINIDNQPNAIGFVSRIAPCAYPVTLIRVDENTGEPLRDNNGLCVKCEPGEPGEFVGKIIKTDPVRDFPGYVSKAATDKKIIHDVFRRGDTAFLSGDMLVMDELGYIYFKDRTGDTFRWRGENVSTSEVEAVISNIVGLKDSVVYGVEVPGCEGRAGMAAILDIDQTLDLSALSVGLVKSLPAYARPLFLRIVLQLDMTGTYKLRKVDLQKQGFELNGSKKDKVYYMDIATGQYLPLDQNAYEKICKGQIRL